MTGPFCIFFVLLLCVPGFCAYRLDFDFAGAEPDAASQDAGTYKKKDGTLIRKYPDRSEAVLPDGTSIVKYHSGERIVSAPDGTIIRIRKDGCAEYEFPGGIKSAESMEAKTPYGVEIPSESRLIIRGQVSVEFFYSPELSDDTLNSRGHSQVKELFDRLYGTVGRIVAENVPVKINPEKPAVEVKEDARQKFRMVFSNCRFCKTGYCSGKKNPEVKILLYHNGKILGEASFLREGLMQRDGHEKTAEETLSILFTPHVYSILKIREE